MSRVRSLGVKGQRSASGAAPLVQAEAREVKADTRGQVKDLLLGEGGGSGGHQRREQGHARTNDSGGYLDATVECETLVSVCYYREARNREQTQRCRE